MLRQFLPAHLRILFAPDAVDGGGASTAVVDQKVDATDKSASKTVDPFASGDDGGDKAVDKEKVSDGDKSADKTIKDKSKDSDKKVDGQADKAKEGDKEKVVAKKKEAFDPQKRINEQNAHITKISTERDAFRKEVEELRAKSGGDTTALTAKLTDYEKQVKELQGKLAARDYSQHPDFVKNYEQPYSSAAVNGKKVFESLEVIENDPTTGEEKRRIADWKKDFAPIYSLPRAAARARAKELFGDDVDAISSTMSQYDKIHELDEKRGQALSEWEKGSDERTQKERAEQIQRQEEAGKAFKSATDDMVESNAELFRDNPEDTEESELRKKGFGIVDPAYFNRDKLTPQELLVRDAAIRLRAGNFLVVQHRLKKAQAEVAELKARIEGEEESASGSVKGKGHREKQESKEDWRSELRTTMS